MKVIIMATIAKPRRTGSRTTRETVKPKIEVETPTNNGDEIWDELFATPESDALLTLMMAEIRQEEAEGTLIEGGWDEV